MNAKRLMIGATTVLVSALLGATAITALEAQGSANSARPTTGSALQDASLPIADVQLRAPFRIRELHDLPAGYALEGAILRPSPTGATNATSVALTYRGSDGGFLELTEIPLRMTLDEGTHIRVGSLDVQYAEHYPTGATTRTYLWRDVDVSLQLNAYIPDAARRVLDLAMLERLVMSAR